MYYPKQRMFECGNLNFGLLYNRLPLILQMQTSPSGFMKWYLQVYGHSYTFPERKITEKRAHLLNKTCKK